MKNRAGTKKLSRGSIRLVALEDAEQILDLYCSIIEEDLYFATSVQDRCRTVEEQEHFIYKAINHSNSAAWVCCLDQEIIGSLFVLGGDLLRTHHRVELEIQVAKEHRGLGIGHALMNTAIREMRKNSRVHKIQLSVLSDNIKAIDLYQRLGFEQEGEIRGAFKEATGQYRSEMIMGLWV
ncbi:MAG: hypothetical protein CMK59_12240 [Proteobacteria bacterium]|nr:hypothetical protein [Pseudomonadota bacterium]